MLREFRVNVATFCRLHGPFALALVLGLTVTIQLNAAGPSGQGSRCTSAAGALPSHLEAAALLSASERQRPVAT